MKIRARRLVRVALFLSLFLVSICIFALAAIRTAWFKDWLRGYVSQEASRFLNGELTIGRLDGNLLRGVELEQVSIRQNGQTIVAIKSLGIDYSILEVVSSGLMLNDIRITQPDIVLRRTAEGWNIGRLVKAEAIEADREGPARPVRIGSIGISDGSVTIEDTQAGSGSALPLPHRISRIDFKGGFAYEPVDFTLDVAHLSLRVDDPSLALNSLSGRLAARGDDVHVERLAVRTAESSLELSGVVKNYEEKPVIQARLTSDRTTLREIAPFAPALSSIELHPAYELSLDGPLNALKVNVNVRTEAGDAAANVRADLTSDRSRLEGSARVHHIRLERVQPSLPSSDLTATATFDVAGRDLETLTGSVRVEAPAGEVAGYRADAVRASARLKGAAADVDAVVRAYGASIGAAGVVRLPRAAGSQASFDLKGKVRDVDLARLPRAAGAPRLRTRLSGAYSAKGETSRAGGQLVFSSSSIDGGTIEPGTTVAGHFDGTRFDVKAKGSVSEVDIARVGRAIGQPMLSDERLADAHITAATFDVAAAGRPRGSMSGSARVEIPEAKAIGGALHDVLLQARVDERSANGSLTGRFQDLDVARASGRSDLDGSVSGSLDVTGSLPDWRTPEVDTASGAARVQLESTRIGTLAVERAALQASLDAGTIDVQQLGLQSNIADATAAGRIAVAATEPSTLRYNVVVKDGAAAGRLAGVTDLSGTVTIEGQLTGTRADLTTNGTLKATDVRYGTTAEVLGAAVEYDVAVPDLTPQNARAEVKAQLSLLKAAGVSAEAVSLDAKYGGQAVDFKTTVRQEARKIEAGGRVELPAAGVNVRLDTLSVAAPDLSWQLTAPARIEYLQPRLTVSPFSVRSGDQEVSVAGTVSLGAGPSTASVAAEAPLSVRASNVDLATVDRLAGTKRGLGGRLDATLTLAGSMDAPIADGTITVHNGAVDTFKFEQLTSTVKADDQRVQIDARLDQQPGTWLNAKATLPPVATLRAGPLDRATVDAHVTSSPIDLGLVSSFTTAVRDVTGTLEADAHVTGTFKAPTVKGQLRVQNGAFRLTAADTAFTGLDAHVALNGSHVEIQSFRLLDPDGKPLSVSGGLTLPGAQSAAADLQLKADDFSVMNSRLGELALDANLRVRGTLGEQVRVDGEVAVHQGRLEVDRLLEQFGSGTYSTEAAGPLSVEVPPVGRETPSARNPEPSPKPAASQAPEDAQQTSTPTSSALLDNLVADVRVRVPNNLVLRGDDLRIGTGGLGLGDLNITVGGDVRTTKAAGNRAVVVGAIRTVRGFYEFQGRRFELQRDGTIGFKGPDPTDPSLDITALREISGVDAIVRVRGTAQRPELELSSRPPLEEADVLSLIIFNRPINELGEGERTALGQRAGSMLGGALAGPVAEALRDALDLDLLEISPVSEGATSPSVTVGSQVGERVFIKVRQSFGSSSQSALLLEYELNELLRLQTSVTEGETDQSGPESAERGGVDLIFVVRY